MVRAVVSEVRPHQKYERLIAAAQRLAALPTAVAHPCDETSLRGAVEAAEAGLIVPILVGPIDRIRHVAQSLNLSIEGFQLIDAPHSESAAEKAVEIVR